MASRDNGTPLKKHKHFGIEEDFISLTPIDDEPIYSRKLQSSKVEVIDLEAEEEEEEGEEEFYASSKKKNKNNVNLKKKNNKKKNNSGNKKDNNNNNNIINIYKKEKSVSNNNNNNNGNSNNNNNKNRVPRKDLKEVPIWVGEKFNTDEEIQSISLGDEIWMFYEYIKPTQSEDLIREYIISQLSAVVRSLWSQSTVEVYGSHATKLALPSSDIDLMIYDAGHKNRETPAVWYPDPLPELFNELKLNHLAKLRVEEGSPCISLIASAQIPVIKLVSSVGGVKVDISVCMDAKPPSTVKVRAFLSEFPILTPLILTLKQFLFQFDLHDTYSGGIGSHCLTLMAISLMQLRKSKNRRSFYQGLKFSTCNFTDDDDVGLALIDFFELYGTMFNYTHGISLLNGGSYFTKKMNHSTNDLLCIEDPSNPSNDVGAKTFRMNIIRGVFHNAYVRLTSSTQDIEGMFPSHNFATLLSRVIQLDSQIVQQRGRAWAIVGDLIQSTAKENNNNNNNNSGNLKSKEDGNNKAAASGSNNTTSKRKWSF